MNENDTKEKKKKIVIYTVVIAASFLVGNLSGYYLNPKCGSFKESTKYILNGIKEFIKSEDTATITDRPIECNCPVCSEDLEENTQKDLCPIKIDVSGAVKNPGVYCFEEGSVIQDAVDKAGGFDTAYGYKYISRKINLAYELKDNLKIYFPFKDDLVCELQSFSPEVEEEEVISSGTDSVSNNSENKEESEDSGCISINNGTKEELMQLSGVGEATAKKIIDARPFSTLEDILNVSGIGDATFEKIKDDICL
jgi:competence protein ComEA